MAATVAGAAAASQFIPRAAFPALTSLPRSYFLGHHKAGLDKMKTMINQIDLVIECRDYRIPLTSRNPLLEEALQGRASIVVYTKHDLGFEHGERSQATSRDSVIQRWHAPNLVHFSSTTEVSDSKSANRLLSLLKNYAATHYSLTGHRILVTGMPNVGKSTLLNALRARGVNKGKAAKTGAQPGVTRKIGSVVKVVDKSVDSKSNVGGAMTEGIYVLDTPGVFMPYVPHAESMLKLALCGMVKDSIIPPITLADYLLFRLNHYRPEIYTEYLADGQPTNDIIHLLEGIARKTGRLARGGAADLEGAAVWMVQRWRGGNLGRFVLDEIGKHSLEQLKNDERATGVSFSQARKRGKEASREKMREKSMTLRGHEGLSTP